MLLILLATKFITKVSGMIREDYTCLIETPSLFPTCAYSLILSIKKYDPFLDKSLIERTTLLRVIIRIQIELLSRVWIENRYIYIYSLQ